MTNKYKINSLLSVREINPENKNNKKAIQNYQFNPKESFFSFKAEIQNINYKLPQRLILFKETKIKSLNIHSG